jgi:carboxypeptidase Taq
MSQAWEKLKPRLDELRDLGGAIALLHWDQLVMMPPRGGDARAQSAATVESIAHARLTDPAVGDLLGELDGASNLDRNQRAHVRVLKRWHDREVKIPPKLVRELAEARALAYQVWTEARPASDFKMLKPHLEHLVQLKKREADAVGYDAERYDALMDVYEPDVTAHEIEVMFAELASELKPLSDAVLEAAGTPPEFLHGVYDEGRQRNVCRWLVDVLGFDFEGGRLDESPHPFTIALAADDVRQTIRTEPNTVLPSVYAAIHETGHALYEQGIPVDLAGLPAGNAASLGMHESQSRLWENHVGRSRAFTDFLLPQLKEAFPDQLGTVTPEEFHRGVNHPQRTLIRVNADEVTYNLHVINRFELELALFREELKVDDLPGAWGDAMEQRLGTRPDSDAEGVLQDMHWPTGAFGYFPTYTIGTLYAAAFYTRATEDLDSLNEQLRRGETGRLLEWLREKVHSQAFLKSAKDIGESVIGGPLTAKPFLDHLREKYSAIYDRRF